VIIAIQVLKVSWISTTRAMNSCGLAALNTFEIGFSTFCVLDINALFGINDPASNFCLPHHSSLITGNW
jgi:hypothetical protein